VFGARVAVADLNLHSYEEFEAEAKAKDMTGESTVAEIEASGGSAFGVELDVMDHVAVDAMVARVVAAWGRVDVLVANAGGGRSRSDALGHVPLENGACRQPQNG
jgi:3-oxoacyl-[acyl-carrier protein] reductase